MRKTRRRLIVIVTVFLVLATIILLTPYLEQRALDRQLIHKVSRMNGWDE
jgi:hypothetical protein